MEPPLGALRVRRQKMGITFNCLLLLQQQQHLLLLLLLLLQQEQMPHRTQERHEMGGAPRGLPLKAGVCARGSPLKQPPIRVLPGIPPL